MATAMERGNKCEPDEVYMSKKNTHMETTVTSKGGATVMTHRPTGTTCVICHVQ